MKHFILKRIDWRHWLALLFLATLLAAFWYFVLYGYAKVLEKTMGL